MSAIAPAGRASSITGMLSAASTNATSDGDDDNDVISHPAPTSCIQVPILDTIVAIHKLRNSAFRRGLHAETGAPAGAACAASLEGVMATRRRCGNERAAAE